MVTKVLVQTCLACGLGSPVAPLAVPLLVPSLSAGAAADVKSASSDSGAARVRHAMVLPDKGWPTCREERQCGVRGARRVNA